MEAEADFSGYATKAGLRCSDGRTIMPNAFQHQDKMTVPLVWQHGHTEPANVLGHAVLENREDGVYAYGFFNDSPSGQNAKVLVQHKDITSMSIYANQLIEKAKNVLHGAIREVSLVLSGANPGAVIDQVRVQHGDGDVVELEDEAIIFTGLELEHSNLTEPEKVEAEKVQETKVEQTTKVVEPEPQQVETPKADEAAVQHADAPVADETVKDIFNTLSDKQKDVVHYMIGSLAGATDVQHSDDNVEGAHDNTEGDLTHQEGNDMSRNVFEQNGPKADGPTLSHDQLRTIVDDGVRMGSFKESLLFHAAEYGIEDIDMLFPDARTVTSTPEFLSRRMEWVASVLDGSKHSPFSRIKSVHADITADEARAKGYVKGNLKKDEIIKLLKRVTTPTTIYKKQKLDRDDIVDITDLDVVAWLKGEMRLMLEEELARAILIGDGREPDDEDKIDEDKLRPIAWDDEMYAHPVTVPANTSPDGIVESVLRARKFYKGTGLPTFYTTDDILTDMILIKDKMGRRLYNTEAELAAALRVGSVVVVEVMENTPDLLGIIVNISDYTIGADRGGALAMFDDFDIDYNQQKFLLETRISGALTKAKSAVVLKRTTGTTVTPAVPAYNETTHVLTVPTVAGVTYYDVTDPGSETALTAGPTTLTRTTDVEARANAGNNFPHNTDSDWTFAFTE